MKNRNRIWIYPLLFMGLALFLSTTCSKTESPATLDPYGMFKYSIKSNGIVSFTNTSENATSYLWDFGDLSTSTSAEAAIEHQYLQNGIYKVTLTAYGNGISSEAYADITITSVVNGSTTDLDGNVYHSVTIGTQLWMVENLKTTKYRNGDPIPNITVATAWGNLTTGAYCDYNNDANNSTSYGRLYNWYAVSDSRKIAPAGWHVPSDAEWTVLTTYLGGENYAGSKLKEAGISHWITPNTGATNSTGFTALPGGYRDYQGTFGGIGGGGYWWSSSERSTGSAWRRNMDLNYSYVGNDDAMEKFGFSVRCLHD